MSEVALTPTEIMQAAMVGVMRQLQNMRDGRRPAFGAGSASDWQLHVEGALGECALAKHLGIFWCGVGALRAPDVGVVDVRTRSNHSYDLILHDHDPDERVFYLLTGGNGRYVVRGWIRAGEGKRKEFWKDPAGGRPAYFVPQEALHHA